MVLKLKHDQLMKAYKALGSMVTKFSKSLKNSKTSSEDFAIYRDALIKRFEFCYDLTWKFLKEYLESKYFTGLNSPKKILQECLQQNIIDEDEAKLFVEIIEARNNTSHTYNEELANEISLEILEYYKLLKKIIKRLKL